MSVDRMRRSPTPGVAVAKTVLGAPATGAAKALRDLRSARRSHRLLDIHWSDSLYRLYVVMGGGGILLWWVVAMIGKPTLASATRLQVISNGPAIGGLLIAFAFGSALRSGSRGGPLSLEAADVTHVLQAPISRATTMLRPFIHQLRRGVYIGALSGLCTGACTRPFLLGPIGGWIGAGVLLGALLGIAFTGIAAIASGHRLKRPVASLAAFGLLIWSIADIVGGFVTAPMTILGSSFFLALPSRASLAISPLVGLGILFIVVIAVAVIGRLSLDGTSLELVERRTALVGGLRFAVTTQDLRAALLLRRQLAAERPRSVPWFRLKGRHGTESAIRIRGMRGIARWPLSRILRAILSAIIAGVCARIAWEHTVPLVVISGLALYLVGLDACDAMAQDVDHPDLAAMMPRHRGRLANRQTLVPFVVLAFVGIISGLSAFLMGLTLHSKAPSDTGTLAFCIALGILGSVTATAGAALNLVIGPPSLSMMLQTPELAVGYTMISPIVGIAGSVAGVLWTRSTFRSASSLSALPGLVRASMVAAALVYFSLIGITSKGLGTTNR